MGGKRDTSERSDGDGDGQRKGRSRWRAWPFAVIAAVRRPSSDQLSPHSCTSSPSSSTPVQAAHKQMHSACTSESQCQERSRDWTRACAANIVRPI